MQSRKVDEGSYQDNYPTKYGKNYIEDELSWDELQ